MPAVYVWEFEVEGSGNFPFDMLRYDACWPANERESVIVGGGQSFRRINSPVTVRLRGIKAPTEGRWRSFGWSVVGTPQKLNRLDR